MLVHIEMTNVIPFKKKKEVYVLKFKTTNVIKFSKRDEHNDIMLEMQKNKGTAWVPALKLNATRKRLHTMMNVLEWVEVHEK